MDISYDIWSGESIQEVIQTIAAFRVQIFPEKELIQSEEINRLHQYFDDQAVIVVANDCGRCTGYMSVIGSIDWYPNLGSYSNFGSDLAISEGPLLHPYYRQSGVEESLIVECLNEAQIRDKQLFIILSINESQLNEDSSNQAMVLDEIYIDLGFKKTKEENQSFWIKNLEN